MIVPGYYEDLKVLHKNTMPNRAYYIPASMRMDGIRMTDRFMLLSGQWKFRYFDSIYDAKEEFFAEGYDTAEFDTVTVPGVWQNYGYDRHQYTNTRYPFPVDPPYVPQKNPCGEYVRTFTYHRDEKAPKAFLNFEGVDSCFYVWVNGVFVGYSQVSHSTSEFDVTQNLREGENTLAVLVLKWCDGSYMEDQDKFRMSGIFRDVYLLRRPEEGIFDYFVKAQPSEDYKSGRVEISFKYLNQPVDVKASLFDREGKRISETEVKDQKAVMEVEKAHLWNAEEPYLYTLVLETAGEVISDQVGIREIHVTDGVLYINGVKVKFHGTNRHDSDPKTGFVISPVQLLKDLKLMKEHNMNAIRTSHYPNAPWAYQLYDQLGFYVIDEADNESHGTIDVYAKELTTEEKVKCWNEMVEKGREDMFMRNPDFAVRFEHWSEAISDNPEFIPSTVDRTQRCVERDKNRPCVVIWSMGNECAYGCTFEEALAWTKEFDPTRLTHYESALYTTKKRKYNFDNLDTYSRMYPTLDEIHSYFKKDGTKPFIMCEYCHAMGNGPGDLEDYFQVVESYDGACGGFMWEWCDHAIDMGKTINGKKMYAYGGDHNEHPHDGNFCMDGLVYPDRTPHTGLLEFKNVYRPARVTAFDQEKKEITLKNYMDFTNLKDYLTVAYEVLCDGVSVESGVIDSEELLNIPAHGERTVPASFTVPTEGKCCLKVSYLLKDGDAVLNAGHLLGFEEVELANAQRQNRKVKALFATGGGTADFRVEEEDAEVTVSTPAFTYVYDKLTGLFKEMVYGNHNLLEQPMEFNVWRAPTDNDRNIKEEWRKAQYDRTVTRAYETEVTAGKDKVVIGTTLSISAVYIQRILNIRALWTILPDGAVDVDLKVEKNPIFPFLPRFGLRLFLPKSMTKVTYCGIGPEESYIDKRRAGYHGVFETNVKAMHEDYIRPQENGSHFDCDYVILQGGKATLTVAGEETFSFNASVYTQEELTEKAHNYELEESPYTVLCVDYRQSGIGSNSCGPELAEEYQLNEEAFEFRVRFVPERV